MDGRVSHASDEGRLSRSWRLTKIAWRIVRTDRTLLVLSLLAAVGTLAVTATLFQLAGLLGQPGSISRGRVLLWVAIFAWPGAFLAAFVDTALAAAGWAALRGEPMTLRRALSVPCRRIAAVLGWSLLAAGVGLLLQLVAERIPFGGRVVQWLGGAAWGLLTLFAIPVLVLERRGPLSALRRSGALIRERWGEGVGGTLAIGVWAAIPGSVAGLLIGIGIATSAPVAHAVLIGLALLIFAAISGLAQSTRQVFTVALYRFAMKPDDPVPADYWPGDLKAPFRKRSWFGG
jgi:hypothetical protein